MIPPRRRRPDSGAWWVGPFWSAATGAVLAAGLFGCKPGLTWDRLTRRAGWRADTRALPTVTDRLRQTYPELESSRFLVLADFEEPRHGEIFTMLTPGQGGYLYVSTRRSRPETGAGSLEAHFSSPEDLLVARDNPEGDWPLPADWRRYELFLMSLYNPGEALALTLEILGRNTQIGYLRPGMVLAPGWNTLRVDLAEVARWVDLERVEQIRWRPEPFPGPTTVYLDDLILADNTVALLGAPDGPAGDLYVVHQGQRIRVGACERFELVFANGQIVAWYDLRRDPARERNGVNWPTPRLAALGPMAVVLRAEDEAAGHSSPLVRGEPGDPTPGLNLDGDRGWSALGRRVGVRQRILEANSLRAVVECERRVGPLLSAAGSPGPGASETGDRNGDSAEAGIRTRYTITPQGRVYVGLDCPTVCGSWQARELGVAFTTSLQGGFEPLCRSAPIQARGQSPPPTCFILFARGRGRPGSSDMLCLAHDPEALPDAVPLEDGGADRVGAMFMTSRLERPRQSWALALVLWPDDIDDEEAAQLLAADYSHPPPLHLEVGQLVRTDPGDLNNDGFNEAQGCYVVRPTGRRARLRLEVRHRPCWYPMFKLVGTEGRRVWAYADGSILETGARAADGSVLIGLNRVLDRPVEIEVVVQAEAQGPRRTTTAAPAPE